VPGTNTQQGLVQLLENDDTTSMVSSVATEADDEKLRVKLNVSMKQEEHLREVPSPLRYCDVIQFPIGFLICNSLSYWPLDT